MAGVGIPYFAGAIVAACDELAAAFIEGAICEREQVSSQNFEKTEALLLIFPLLLDQFLDKLLELGFTSFRDERLLE